MTRNPTSVTIRTYDVGFGDCFLLSFKYDADNYRHVLIDCGSQASKKSPKISLQAAAQSIKALTGGKLHVVVATHRHQDHISGFGMEGVGSLIEAMAPDAVLQPWTEDPDIPEDADAPPLNGRGSAQRKGMAAHRQTLASMNALAESLFADPKSRFLKSLRSDSAETADQLRFTGSNNIKNRKAVDALQRMSADGKGRYLHAGQNPKLGRILPGVKVEVLGPPTVVQHARVRKQTSRHKDEFWHLSAACASGTAAGADPFAGRKPAKPSKIPQEAMWFTHRLSRLHTDSMLGIVRQLDRAMNNTSLILLFTVGDKAFLFPGDAQLENWEYAMSQPKVMAKLAQVDVYKVGHHGSLNATPKSVWAKLVDSDGTTRPKKQLTTLLSTMHGKHGHDHARTEVPRRTLLAALKSKSRLINTEDFEDELYQEVVVPLSEPGGENA